MGANWKSALKHIALDKLYVWLNTQCFGTIDNITTIIKGNVSSGMACHALHNYADRKIIEVQSDLRYQPQQQKNQTLT